MTQKNKFELNTEDITMLETAYKKAVEEKKESFIFYGRTVITAYAKYLLEYLKPK